MTYMQLTKLRIAAQSRSLRAVGWLALALVAAAASGCQAFYAPVSTLPVTPAEPQVSGQGTELEMFTLPSYVIEPPDILLINVVRTVPKPPHRLQPFDALAIRVAGTSLAEPIAGIFFVNEAGRVDFGAGYGSVEVADLSVEEARTAITRFLDPLLDSPLVTVSLASSSVEQSINGQHLVAGDGRITLGVYGSVYVAGMTIDQARQAIETHLSRDLLDPKVVVEVLAYNSKKFTIITEATGFGDNVIELPLVGNDTVLSAIAAIGGVSQFSSGRMYIARPAPVGRPEQILEVNWEDIKNGRTATNYQLLAGDRLILVEDPLVHLDAMIGRVTRPFERLFGFSLLGAQSIQRMEAFGNDGRNN